MPVGDSRHYDHCVDFLQWCLPHLELRWPGFRKVRRTVCKRLRRRVRALGLDGLDAYRGYLEAHDEEWPNVDAYCRIPISRFYRDRQVFEAISDRILPDLAHAAEARDAPALEAWSAGSASGEEAYSLAILWCLRLRGAFPDIAFNVLGTDADQTMIRRAEAACYPAGSLRDLTADWRTQAFALEGDQCCLRPDFRKTVQFREQDLRLEMPEGPFDLILCRNVAFTYFARPLQTRILRELNSRLLDGGVLVIGGHETLPDDECGFVPVIPSQPIYGKRSGQPD